MVRPGHQLHIEYVILHLLPTSLDCAECRAAAVCIAALDIKVSLAI